MMCVYLLSQVQQCTLSLWILYPCRWPSIGRFCSAQKVPCQCPACICLAMPCAWVPTVHRYACFSKGDLSIFASQSLSVSQISKAERSLTRWALNSCKTKRSSVATFAHQPWTFTLLVSSIKGSSKKMYSSSMTLYRRSSHVLCSPQTTIQRHKSQQPLLFQPRFTVFRQDA